MKLLSRLCWNFYYRVLLFGAMLLALPIVFAWCAVPFAFRRAVRWILRSRQG